MDNKKWNHNNIIDEMRSQGYSIYEEKINPYNIINNMKTQNDKTGCQQINAEFWFGNEYIDSTGLNKIVTVVLHLNYKTHSYNIVPYCGTINNGFTFVNNQKKKDMWKTVLKCINDAIDFAEKELSEIETA